MLDICLGESVDFYFTTIAPATGVPTQLAGTPVVSAYPDNSTTQLTAGVGDGSGHPDVDFDTVTGLNHVRVAATAANGYAIGKKYTLVITTGTVGGNSVVGYVVGEFSIQKQTPGLIKFTCTTGGSTTSIPCSSCYPQPSATDAFKGRVIIFNDDTTTAALRGQATIINGNDSSATPTFTIASGNALSNAPTNGDTGRIY